MGGKTSTTTSQVQIPPEVMANYNAVNAMAKEAAVNPFQTYSPDTSKFVAQMNPTQLNAMGPLNIDQYKNPYIQDVVKSTMDVVNQQNQQAQAGQLGTAISSGAFGGDRSGIAAANLAQQQQMANAQIASGLYSDAYNQALATAQQQQGFQFGAGTLQQQTDQAGLTALYNQWLQQQAYPFQTAQFLGNIAMGTGALSGSTTTTTQPYSFFKRGGSVRPGLAGGGIPGPYSAPVGSIPGLAGYIPDPYLPVSDMLTADPAYSDMAQQSAADYANKIAEYGKAIQSTFFADGGTVDPRGYLGSVLDAQEKDRPGLHPAETPASHQSGGLGDILKVAAMFMSRGGYADGGSPEEYNAMGNYVGSYKVTPDLSVADISKVIDAAVPPAPGVVPPKPDLTTNAVQPQAITPIKDMGVIAPAPQFGVGTAKMPVPAQQPGVAPVTAGTDLFPYMLVQESGNRQLDKNGRPITSHAGAVGAAQVMEATGPEAARIAGIEWDRNRWMYDYDYNVAIGRAYYNEQIRTFGDPIKAVAAYNAGPGNVSSAIDRATAIGGNWYDYIPEETKNYVNSVSSMGGSGANIPVARTNSVSDVGLGGASMDTPAYAERNALGQIFYNPTTNKLDKNALLAVLGGIGTMASSPSRFLGSAILQGLGGFANTYAGLQKQRADIDIINAQANAQNVGAANVLSAMWKNNVYEAADGRIIYKKPNGEYVYMGDVMADPQAHGVTPEQAASLPPEIQSKIFTEYGVNPEDIASAIKSDVGAVNANYAATMTESNDLRKNIRAAGVSAEEAMPTTVTQAVAVSGMGGSAGAIANIYGSVLSYLNRAATVFGKPEIKSDVPIDQQNNEKSAIINAMQAAGQIDAAGIQTIEMALAAQPDPEKQPEVNASIMAFIMVNQMKAVDKAKFVNAYANMPGNNNHVVNSAPSVFAENTTDQYYEDQKNIKDIIIKGSTVPEEWIKEGRRETPIELITSSNYSNDYKKQTIINLGYDEAEADRILKYISFGG